MNFVPVTGKKDSLLSRPRTNKNDLVCGLAFSEGFGTQTPLAASESRRFTPTSHAQQQDRSRLCLIRERSEGRSRCFSSKMNPRHFAGGLLCLEIEEREYDFDLLSDAG